MSCEPITGCVMQSSTFGNKARLVDINDVALLQAGISGITWTCWNPSGTKVIDAVALVVATVISDTLLTTGWDVDAIGYNFVHAIGASVAVVAGVHTIEYRVTPVVGDPFTTRKFTPDVQATGV